MEVRREIIVPLGYGKYVRSDKIIAMEPIEEERGPRRRTKVYVEGIEGPLIASRAEGSILRNLVEVPSEVMEAVAAMELLKDILDDLRQVGPMLRRSIREEGKIDLDSIEKRITEILKGEEDDYL